MNKDYKLINDMIKDDFFTLIISKNNDNMAVIQTCDKIKIRKAYLTLLKYEWIYVWKQSPNELCIKLSEEDFDEMFPDF